MKRWRMLVFLIVCLNIFVYVLATDQKPTNGYRALLNLHQEFSKFRRPVMVNGIPDYSRDAIKSREKGLKVFHQRLDEINVSGGVLDRGEPTRRPQLRCVRLQHPVRYGSRSRELCGRRGLSEGARRAA